MYSNATIIEKLCVFVMGWRGVIAKVSLQKIGTAL